MYGISLPKHGIDISVLMLIGSLELDKPPSLGSNRAESKSFCFGFFF
jgi:hypothetical protein